MASPSIGRARDFSYACADMLHFVAEGAAARADIREKRKTSKADRIRHKARMAAANKQIFVKIAGAQYKATNAAEVINKATRLTNGEGLEKFDWHMLYGAFAYISYCSSMGYDICIGAEYWAVLKRAAALRDEQKQTAAPTL